MSNKQCKKYLELLELSREAWEQDDNNETYKVRQSLLNHILERTDLHEEDVSHLR